MGLTGLPSNATVLAAEAVLLRKGGTEAGERPAGKDHVNFASANVKSRLKLFSSMFTSDLKSEILEIIDRMFIQVRMGLAYPT